MKKRKLSTIIKRVLLFSILGVIILFVCIFFFDQYKPVDASVDNKYPDEYWNKKVLEGFKYYDDIVSGINVFNKNSEEYLYPWEYEGISEATLTDKQKLDMARYYEEVETIFAPLQKELNKFYANRDFTAMYKANNATVDEWIELALELSKFKYESLSTTLSPIEAAADGGYTLTNDDLIDDLKYVCNNDYVLGRLEDNGFDVDDEDKLCILAVAIVNDTSFFDAITTGDADYLENETRYNELLELEEYANSIRASMTDNKWADYTQKNLLGYGGLATDYPNKPVLSVDANDGTTYELWFNSILTTFKLVQRDSLGTVLQTWYSNVDEDDPNANNDVKKIQNTTLQVSYAILKGENATYSTYEYSVADKNLSTGEALTPNFAFKVDEENNTLTVWYALEKRGIDYTYFPQRISAERIQELYDRNAAMVDAGENVPDLRVADTKGLDPNLSENTVEVIQALNPYYDPDYTFNGIEYFKKVKEARQNLTSGFYNIVKADDAFNEYGYVYYEISESTYGNKMSKIMIKSLYTWLYEWCDYCGEGHEDDLENDNEEFGAEIDINNPYFEIAIEYELTPNGLNVTIPGNSIKESEDFPISYIDILPYMGATVSGVEGYTVIPDGSGQILIHDNGNTNFSKYQKRVYTTDLTKTEYVNQGSFEDLMMPLYAVINTGDSSGLLCYATKGAGQLQLTCDISGHVSSYNTNAFSAFLREVKTITLGQASYERRTINKWTTNKYSSDICLTYKMLNTDEQSYAGAAKVYREYLMEEYGISAKDNTTSPVLNLDVIASYSYKENFIGIPYTARKSLTTVEQLNEIIDAVSSLGVENINVSYLGWRTKNLVDYSFKNMKSTTLIGSRAKFKALLEANNSNVAIYPYVSFGEIVNYQESFGKYHYTSHAVDGDYAERQPYDINSNVFDKTKKKIYAISPRYYLAFATELVDSYKKATGSSYIAVDKLGSSLAGDYKKNIETFKSDAVLSQIESLEYLYNNGLNNLTLYTPYDYAFKYVNVAREVPYIGTSYEILDYSVPFYQLVVNGLFDYSSDSVNKYSEKGLTEHIMRMIETGSNITFTLTGDSSEELLQTDYNTYYYTLYTDWLTDIKSIYDELDSLGIYALELTGHERLDNNVYKVTYSDGGTSISIILNYTRNPYTVYESDGTTVKQVVAAKSYSVAS